jgi:hypothetical protein
VRYLRRDFAGGSVSLAHSNAARDDAGKPHQPDVRASIARLSCPVEVLLSGESDQILELSDIHTNPA